jgi:chemotaxis protein methyltransferase CheR
MKDENFAFLQDLLRRRSANVLDDGKEYLVRARLSSLASTEGYRTVDQLLEHIRLRPSDPLTRQVIESLVTTETSFFRDHHPFEALRREILPELARKRSVTRTLHLWSAACSSGQEAYSLAMLISDHYGLAGWNVHILGTDLSSEMVERARQGRYSQLEVNRGIPSHLLVRYFDRAGFSWQVSSDLKRMVEFQQLNLADPLPYLPRMDVIFMRNVLIYLADEVKRQVLRRIAAQLRPDGYLAVGGAETMIGYGDLFVRRRADQTSFYQPRSPEE